MTINLSKAEKVNLTQTERDELKSVYSKGFRYLVRNEIGSVEVFTNEPIRTKERRFTLDIWVEKEDPYPIITPEKMKCRKFLKAGEYKFVQWETDPILIIDLIK